jgi:isopentenyldiphosphate isomerase
MKKDDDELLDLVNDKDEVIGTVWKSEAHKDPSRIHREVDITIFNEKNETLIQKRGILKEHHPGKWENAATGHVKAGEKPIVAICRELFEEVGLKAIPIFYKKIFRENKNEARFVWLYYAIVKSKQKINIGTNEVEEVLWILPDRLKEFSQDHWWDINGFSHKEIMTLKALIKK